MTRALTADARILWRMARGKPRTGDAQTDLTRFYAPQAAHYDRFREKLLHGRERMLSALGLGPGMHVCELGAGTGRNVEYFAELAPSLASITLVDLCNPLLEIAKQRLAHLSNVHIHHGDAADFRAAHGFDRVYCAYSLTMMPSWQAVLDNARSLLTATGRIGVVDFYVAKRGEHMAAQSYLKRQLLRRWFAHDGVDLDSRRLKYLRERFVQVVAQESEGGIPYVPAVRAPYYLFVGANPQPAEDARNSPFGRLSAPSLVGALQDTPTESNHEMSHAGKAKPQRSAA